MYQLELTNRFKKDLKLAKKSGLEMKILDLIVSQLLEKGNINSIYKPHLLKGNYKGYWECHIQPDWLLIWKQDDVIKLVTLTRTGTHSDLF